MWPKARPLCPRFFKTPQGSIAMATASSWSTRFAPIRSTINARSTWIPSSSAASNIPCSFTKTYHPVADPASRVVISVYEGDAYDDPESPENVKLAEIPWEFDPPRAQRDGAIEVSYEYGDDGILTVELHDLHIRHRKRFAIQQSGEDPLDASQLIKLKRSNEDLLHRTVRFEALPEYREALEVLRKTERQVIPGIEDAEDRRELEILCRAVRVAMSAADKKRMEEATRGA